MKRSTLSRRTVLRGLGMAGVSIGLPPLDRDAVAAPPVRAIFYTINNGVPGLDRWNPKTTGRTWTMSPCLEPLAAFQSDLTVVSGLRHTAYFKGKAPGDHARGNASLLTGMPTDAGGATGVSLDQILAKQIGQGTRFSSLQVVADNAPSADKYPHMASVSFSGPGQPNPSIGTPGKLFEILTGAGAGGVPKGTPSTTVDPAIARRRSVLDYVRGDLADLNKVLGARDRERIDGHLTALRELEKQVGLVQGGVAPSAPSASCEPGARPNVSGENDPKIRVMVRLSAMALQCNLTRVMLLQYGHAVSYQQFPWLTGLIKGEGDHFFSHRDPTSHLGSTRYKMTILAEFLKLLKSVPEGGGTMLDHTLIFCSSEVGTGNHGCGEMPVLLAGHAGGALPGGVHVKHAGQPVNRLLLTMSMLVGGSSTKFGIDGDSPLDGLKG